MVVLKYPLELVLVSAAVAASFAVLLLAWQEPEGDSFPTGNQIIDDEPF